jgi:hypothetical protein
MKRVALLLLPWILSAQFHRAEQDREIHYWLLEPDTHQFRISHDFTVSRPGQKYVHSFVRKGSVVTKSIVIDLGTGKVDLRVTSSPQGMALSDKVVGQVFFNDAALTRVRESARAPELGVLEDAQRAAFGRKQAGVAVPHDPDFQEAERGYQSMLNDAQGMRDEIANLEEQRETLRRKLDRGDSFLNKFIASSDPANVKASLNDVELRLKHQELKLEEFGPQIEVARQKLDFFLKDRNGRLGDFLNEPDNARRLFDPAAEPDSLRPLRIQLLSNLLDRLELFTEIIERELVLADLPLELLALLLVELPLAAKRVARHRQERCHQFPFAGALLAQVQRALLVVHHFREVNARRVIANLFA